MSEYTLNFDAITEGAVPKSNAGRPKRVNPLVGIVGKYADKRDVSATFTLPLPADRDTDDKFVAQIKRDLTQAGAHHNVMVRRVVTPDTMARTVTVTFWTADKAPKSDADAPKATKGK